MSTSPVEALQRTLGQGGSRRTILGAVAAAALTRIGLNHVEAKKKRKNKKKKKKNRRKGGNGGGNNGGGGGNNGGGGGGGGGNECQFELCDGLCVDLATDPRNCGVCGNSCAAGDVCRKDFCVSVIGAINGAFGIAGIDSETFVVTAADEKAGKVFNDGVIRGTFGVPGDGAVPTGVAFDPGDGGFVILDTAGSRVLRFDKNGVFVSEFGSFGSGQNQFEQPEGVAIDPLTRQIFVLDKGNGRVSRFTSTGFFLNQIGRAGSAEGQFNNPRGIAIDADRNLVVADTGNNRVQILNQDGDVIRVIGRAGGGNG
ncbi:MAG: hypothetical protein KC432_10615, partial [Thermomicrobiales bacterium]|nr:hypothetical protein [Thermomicrobiales bacterium]